MANLTIRNEPSSSIVPDIGFPIDPFQAVREMLRWDPFAELYRGFSEGRTHVSFNPTFDVRETNDSFIIQADVPGVMDRDVEISLTNNRLTVNGRRENEQETRGETYYRAERHWGAFSRTFTLPSEVDVNHVNAELKNGVLMVTLPKAGEGKTRRIQVQQQQQQEKKA